MPKKKDPMRVKAGKKAKTKGNNFERDVALAFETAWGDPTRRIQEREFRRTPVSGGFRVDYPGDLVVPDWFPFMPECKHSTRVRPAASYFNFFDEADKNWLVNLYLTENPKAAVINKAVILIFKDNSKPCVLMAKAALEMVDPTYDLGYGDPVIHLRLRGIALVILAFSTFCEEFTKTQLADAASQMKREGLPDQGLRATS